MRWLNSEREKRDDRAVTAQFAEAGWTSVSAGRTGGEREKRRDCRGLLVLSAGTANTRVLCAPDSNARADKEGKEYVGIMEGRVSSLAFVE